MGSKGSQKTESTSTATSAPNAQAGALYGDILNQLQGYVQQNPNAPTYQGQQVAQFTPDQQTAMNTVNQAQGAYQPYLQQAGQFAQQAGSAITPGQISAAMSPYQQQVIDATMAKMDQRNAQQMSSLKGTEAQQGAFGGSRAAVTEATLGGQQDMNMASTLAGLNNQNYTQAVAQAQANRSAAGTGAQLESGLGTQSMQLPMYGAQQQLQTGAQQQQLAQQNLNVPYQQWLQQQSWTPQMLQFEAGLGTGVGSQMGGTSTNAGTATTTPAQPSPWMQGLGLATSIAAMPVTGGGSLFGNYLSSDKRAKENIEPVGHLNDGQKIYKYNYKGDPHTQIGLIAQEVERKHPEAVGESNGLKTVNYDLATRNAVHKADGGSVGSDIVGNAVRMARQMREGMAGGGVPGAGLGTSEYMGHSIPAIIPTSQMAMGKGAPSTPGFVSSPEMKDPNAGLMKGLGSGLGTLAKAGYDKWNEPTDGSRGVGLSLTNPSTLYSLGGTVSPESAYHGFAHRASGGDVVFDPTPISEQGGEDPNKAPVMPPEGFTDQPPSIVPAGEFKPYEAPPQADVPMPRPRPENLGVDDLAAALMPIGAAAEAPVPMPRPRPAQTAAQPTDDIFTRLLRTESNGLQLDENGNPLTSPKGATGIAQIMPTTGPEAAKLAGLPWDEQKFKYDANYNAALGKAYFDHQTNVFGGDPEKGAAAYNAGPGRLREAMAMAAAHGGSYKDYLPAETQYYLGKLFGQKQDDAELPPNARPTAYTGGVNEPISQDVSNQYAPFVGPRGDEGGDRTNPAINVAAQAIVPKNDDSRKLPQNLSILERVLGKEFDPATRQAIMAAGLRMMTTPGNIGTVLGTAGMQGMATYSEAKQMEQAQDEARRKQAFEREKHEDQFNRQTMAQKETAAQHKIQQEYMNRRDERADESSKRAENREERAAEIQRLALDPTSGFTEKIKNAMTTGVHGREFLNQIDDPANRNVVEAVANYQLAPNAASSKFKGDAKRLMALVYQANPDYDDSWYKNKAQTLKNFYSSSTPNSPVVLSRAANTAIGHAGDLAKAIKVLQTANPGLLQDAKNSGTPILSYLSGIAQQKLYKGTPSGEALNVINTVLPLYAAETGKFYSGTGGADREKQEIIEPLRAAGRSYQELMGALRAQLHMFSSKIDPMEQEFRDAMNAPGLTEYGTKPEVKQWKAIKTRGLEASKEIEQIYEEAHPPAKPAVPPAAGSGNFTGRTASRNGETLREISDPVTGKSKWVK